MRRIWARRKDRPHQAIVAALEASGCTVLDVSAAAGVGCDLVVWRPDGRAFAIEVKDGDQRPSARKLTKSEARLAWRMPRHYRILGSVEEAVAFMDETVTVRRTGGR